MAGGMENPKPRPKPRPKAKPKQPRRLGKKNRVPTMMNYTFLLVVAMALPLGLAAADDDEVVPAEEVAAGPRVRENFEGVFDQWLFNGMNNAATGRQKIEAQIKLQLAELERVCQLTEPQK